MQLENLAARVKCWVSTRLDGLLYHDDKKSELWNSELAEEQAKLIQFDLDREGALQAYRNGEELTEEPAKLIQRDLNR